MAPDHVAGAAGIVIELIIMKHRETLRARLLRHARLVGPVLLLTFWIAGSALGICSLFRLHDMQTRLDVDEQHIDYLHAAVEQLGSVGVPQQLGN